MASSSGSQSPLELATVPAAPVLSNPPLRLSPLLKNLSLSTLVARGIIPPIPTHFAVTPKKYPPWVYRDQTFPFYGLWLDYIVRAGLRIFLKQNSAIVNPSVCDTMPAYAVYCTTMNLAEAIFASYHLVVSQFGNAPYTEEEIRKHIGTLTNKVKDLVKCWKGFDSVLGQGTICSEMEYRQGDLAGHPDVVIWQNSGSSIILDIKCSANFATYQHHSWLQILGYAALARVNNVAVQYIGLIMPLQRVINLVDIGQWDSSLYLAILLQEADTAASIGSSSTVNFVGILESVLGNLLELPVAPPRHLNIPISLNIGHHIHKPKVLAQGFIEYSQKFPNCPTQIFLRSRTGAFGQKTIGQIPAARDFIVQQPLKIYIHAPYTINLCANVSTPEGDFWQQRILNEDLAMANGMGSMGVIVHTGATCNRPLDQALNTMEFMVRTALAYATPGCPLLLETPVGEGTEVCSDLASFAQFCNRFTMEERDRLGICVDSCHVFAAGVDPLVYLQQWEHYCNIRIGLVHFNDSLGPKGSHVDRHASIGKGYIGETQMMEVATWCAQRDISMVVE